MFVSLITEVLSCFITVLSSSPPSEDFQNLLKGLLTKNPDKRSGSDSHRSSICYIPLLLLLLSSSAFIRAEISHQAAIRFSYNYSTTFLQFCFLSFRLDWSDLLDHSFWSILLMEEEVVEEEGVDDEEHQEGKNGCEGVGSASLR